MWDFQETQTTLFFQDIPLNKEIVLTLTNWYEELKNMPSESDCRPIFLSATNKHVLKLNDGKTISESTKIQIGFWRSIYEKWKDAPKPKNINSLLPVTIKIKKISPKRWYILEITQEAV